MRQPARADGARLHLLLLLASASVADAAGGYWGDFTDYLSIALWILWALVLLSLSFDEGVHRLGYWIEVRRERANRLTKRTAAEMSAHGLDDFDPLNRFEVYSRTFNRFKSEMMVLGFLAFAVWICNVSGIFHQITLGVHDFDSSATNISSSECGRMLSEQRRRLGGSGEAGESGAVRPSTYHDYFFRPQADDQCARNFMREGAELLHLVERCHMVLFITMCAQRDPNSRPTRRVPPVLPRTDRWTICSRSCCRCIYFLLMTVSLVRVHALYSQLHQARANAL